MEGYLDIKDCSTCRRDMLRQDGRSYEDRLNECADYCATCPEYGNPDDSEEVTEFLHWEPVEQGAESATPIGQGR